MVLARFIFSERVESETTIEKVSRVGGLLPSTPPFFEGPGCGGIRTTGRHFRREAAADKMHSHPSLSLYLSISMCSTGTRNLPPPPRGREGNV